MTNAAMAATPIKLETIAVTPAAKTISVGQKQSFTATGTFSNGSKQVLGPALSNIAPGSTVTCAVLTSGGVECWGDNTHGQLGDGTTAHSLIPRPVKGIRTATAAASGGWHGCALLASGALKCWGWNLFGALGNGSYTESHIPVSVTGISTATAVDAGEVFSCALLASGAVKCWGDNEYGQLGNGSYTESSIPVSVTGISTAMAITVGLYHACAVLSSGPVKCWGYNAYGGLGNGTRTDSNTPVTVRGISNATAVAAGVESSCALLASGAVKCWGDNESGQLGNGSTAVFSRIPVSVTGISTATAITAGTEHNCAVLRSGSVKCWGDNWYGQLGNGTTTDANTPVTADIHSPIRLAAGMYHTCALFSGGMMRCWGWNDWGQLGNRRRTSFSALPVTVVGTPGVVWESSNPSKATITDRGVATGRAAGNTTITATTAGFINDNAVLTVK